MNNIYQETFYAEEQVDANNTQTTLVLDKGTLIVDKTSIQITINIPDFLVQRVEEDPIGNPGVYTDFDYTRADAAHGSNLKFYVLRERPLANLRSVLCLVDSQTVLNSDDIRPLQSTQYQSKYRQGELLLNNYDIASNNIRDVNNSILQFVEDFEDITTYDTNAGFKTLSFSIPIADILPMMFEENEINILDNMQIIMNFKDMLNLFFISGCGTTSITVENVERNLQNYAFTDGAYVDDEIFQTHETMTLDLKVNAAYRIQPLEEMTIMNETISNQYTSKNIQSNVKVQDDEISLFQSFCLFDDTLDNWMQNIIPITRLKAANKTIQLLKNNREIANNQEIAAYNTGTRLEHYLINLLNLQNDNNKLNCKNIGEFTKAFYRNKLFEYRMYLDTTNASPQFNLYVNYIKAEI